MTQARKKLIAANWKMHKLPSEAEAWARDLVSRAPVSSAEIVICAAFTHLAALSQALEGSAVMLGAQDVSAHHEGAYTGEVAAAMLKDLGVHYVIVGHSERRAYHHEDDALVRAKVERLLEAGLVPIVCVGESLEAREAGDSEEVVLGQLGRSLSGLELGDRELVVAYEPIWAIGTGKTASASDAQEVARSVRAKLAELFGARGERVRVLYGGSMKPANAGELLGQDDIDGGLIGGASLELDALLEIAGAA